MWRWGLLVVVHLLRVSTASAADTSPIEDGIKQRSGIDSRHADHEERNGFQALIIPMDKLEELKDFNKNIVDQEVKDLVLQASNSEGQPILKAKISPLTLKTLHIPHLPLSPKLELLKQRIKLKKFLIKAKLLHRKLTPGLLRSTQTEPDLVPEGSSEELLANVLGSSNKNVGSKNDLIKNTVLTKTTTYNITNLKNDSNDPELLISKKEDVLINMNLLDKKGRPTNFSNAHSSISQVIIDSDTEEEEESFNPFIANINLDEIADTNKKYKGLDGNNSKINEFVGNAEINEDNSNEVTTKGIRKNCDSDDLTGAECDYKKPTDFVNGQFTSYENRFDPIVGSPNTMSRHNHTFEMVSGQLIPSNEQHNLIEHTSYEVAEADPSSTEDSVIGLVNRQETTSEMNIGDHETTTSVESISSDITTNKEKNTLEKSHGRSDISISNEEPSEEHKERNLYDPISILGESNSQSQIPNYSNETGYLKNDSSVISNRSTENYSDLKNMDDEPGAILNRPNKYRAKSGEKNVIESSQFEDKNPASYNNSVVDESEDVGGSDSSMEGRTELNTILGGTESPGTSYEDDGNETTTNVNNTLMESLEDDKEKSENSFEQSLEDISEDKTILMKDNDSGNSVTEMAELNTNNNSTKTTNDYTVGGPIESSEVDKVGEPSSLEPTQSNSSLVEILQNDNESEEDELEDDELTTHPVELSAGNKLFSVGDYSNTEGPYSEDEDDEGEYLTEICFPLKNKNLSLLDLLSGHFYVKTNGKKYSIHLDNPMKNCTSATKKCKLYFDLIRELKTSDSENEMDLSEESSRDLSSMNKKRHIRTMLVTGLNNNRSIEIYEVFNKSLNNLEPMEQIDISRIKEDNVATSDTQFAPKENFNNEHSIVSSENLSPDTLSTRLFVSNTDSREYQPIMASSKLTEQLSDKTNIHPNNSEFRNYVYASHSPQDDQKHNPRTAREVEGSNVRSCSCDSNILQSPSPKIGYQHFVQKRLAILTNIVHAVNDWRTDSKEDS